MLRVHFTAEDLARLRMIASLGPVSESVFALHLIRRGGNDVFQGWRRRVRHDLGGRLGDFEQLAGTYPYTPDLAWLHRRQPGPTVFEERGRRRLAVPILEFCQKAVMPYWTLAHRYLEAERELRGRIAISHGVERLLSTLHPRVRWNAPTLEVPGGPHREVYLDGRGLLLSPSLFLHEQACAFIPGDPGAGLPALSYAMPVDEAMVAEISNSPRTQEDALGALIGHTRAAALQVLTDSCTTGELSQRLGISLAGASKHAKVLRKAGLIATARNRNTALHTLTSLGVALLQNREAHSRESNRIGA